MKREQIDLEEVIKQHGIITEDWDETMHYPFEYVQEEQTDYDGEKHYVTLELVFKRKSDNKYFKVKCEDWGHSSKSVKGFAYEVFPRQITKTIYE